MKLKILCACLALMTCTGTVTAGSNDAPNKFLNKIKQKGTKIKASGSNLLNKIKRKKAIVSVVHDDLEKQYIMTDEELNRWIDAAVKGDIKVIQSFIKKGVNVDQTDEGHETALWYAATHGRRDIVELLLNNGADINYCKSYTALAAAASGLHVDTVKLLLDKGADPNKSVEYFLGKEIPLISAVDNIRPNDEEILEIVHMLLDKGADPNIGDEEGQTALMISLRWGHTEVVRLLTSVLKMDQSAMLDLLYDTKYNHARSDEYIEQKGQLIVDLNSKDKYGKTALMHAIISQKISEIDRVEIVKLLLDKGADPNLKDKKGKTALEYAKGNKTIFEMLSRRPHDERAVRRQRKTAERIAHQT